MVAFVIVVDIVSPHILCSLYDCNHTLLEAILKLHSISTVILCATSSEHILSTFSTIHMYICMHEHTHECTHSS